MKKFIFLIPFLFTRLFLIAQAPIEPASSRPLNSIYINLLGDASLLSMNYERNFLISNSFLISGKLGLGYNEEFQLCIFGPCSPPDNYITIPHHITGNVGKGRHFLEFGLGGTLINGNTSQTYLLYPIIGYKLLPLKPNKLNFRIFGQIPFSGLVTEDILFIPVGISIGISFRN
jgi:hypothetical protein